MTGTKTDIERTSKALAQATNNLERELGGREALRGVLNYLPEESKYRILADALADPDNDNASLARICESLSIKVEQFPLIFRDARAAKALALSLDAVYDGLPRVAGTAMKYGSEHHQLCPVCLGTCQVEVPAPTEEDKDATSFVDCKRCRATGKILYVPDNDRVKTALEVGGMLKKGPSTQVTIDQSKVQNNVFDSKNLRDFLAATDKALRVTKVVDVTPNQEQADEER